MNRKEEKQQNIIFFIMTVLILFLLIVSGLNNRDVQQLQEQMENVPMRVCYNETDTVIIDYSEATINQLPDYLQEFCNEQRTLIQTEFNAQVTQCFIPTTKEVCEIK